jgi:hypothetical protein
LGRSVIHVPVDRGELFFIVSIGYGYVRYEIPDLESWALPTMREHCSAADHSSATEVPSHGRHEFTYLHVHPAGRLTFCPPSNLAKIN